MLVPLRWLRFRFRNPNRNQGTWRHTGTQKCCKIGLLF
jgi:hypothetical protein